MKETRLRLILLSDREYTSLTLPEKCAGSYWIRGRAADGRLGDLVSVEAQMENGQPRWTLKSNRRFQIEHKSVPAGAVALVPDVRYGITASDATAKYTLYVEPLSDDRRRFQAYLVTGAQATFVVAREAGGSFPGENARIRYASQFVSQPHAYLTYRGERFEIREREGGSTNHTYVNGKAIGTEPRELRNGDLIYIMGLRIITVGRYLFMNNPEGKLSLSGTGLTVCRDVPRPGAPPDDLDEEFREETKFYYRAPRFRSDAETLELHLDPPPSNPTRNEMPMALAIGPSVTMGLSSAASAMFAIVNAAGSGDLPSAFPTVVMSGSMLLGSMFWPVLTRTYQRNQRRLQEEKRQVSYDKYLQQMGRYIEAKQREQEQILRENSDNARTLYARILARPPKIWERTRRHADFLSIVLGYGQLPARIKLDCQGRTFSIEEDNLFEKMYALGERHYWLNDVPITLSLLERYVAGVCGERENLVPYATNLILQLAAQHGYDELKLVVLYDPEDADHYAFTRYLPHTWEENNSTRYVATTQDEVKALSAALDGIFEYRRSGEQARREDLTPHYVVVCLDRDLAAQAECVQRIREYPENLGFSVLALFERMGDLPRECSAVAELRDAANGQLTLMDAAGSTVGFRTDAPRDLDVWPAVSVLANTPIDTGAARFTLPKQYSFFEMLRIGMPEHLNLLERWNNSNPVKTLAAEIGVDRYGGPFRLDLHQDAHGPHGLIAGTTGSGKSEFIISLLLSLALNYSPRELAFILIDYKGGGMSDTFKNIPHTAGIITNLDGKSGIDRALASLHSEIDRRERIFKDVSGQHQVNNIDIYKYQNLVREGKVKEAMPHLLIISDEFAELKADHDEFMKELVRTARVGRSLGVHLILATQKPGGVVSPEILSNSRFKIALKVQDNSDSVEVLGRPEAASLVDTGRFYLQVGNNEIFELGQSAWAGAPYYPSPSVLKNRDDAVSVLDTGGHVIREANFDRFAAFQNPPKQMDALTNYITQTSAAAGIGRWKMWLDPIPARIYLDGLTGAKTTPGKYDVTEDVGFALKPAVGEYDDPARQRQGLLTVPVTEAGNVLVYGSAGSGKAMFLEALCASLLRRHTPREVSLYILDFDAELLSAFAEAPHVGGVFLAADRERIENLFKLLLRKLETRRKLFAPFGGSLEGYNRQAKQAEPNLVVLIHNYAAFAEMYEDRAADVQYLTREGTKYGIYFALTCTGVNNVRPSLRQNFKQIFCLQMNNADDYASVVGRTGGLLPQEFPGRGLFSRDGGVLEFQTARVTDAPDPYAHIRADCARMRQGWRGSVAEGIRILPERVTMAVLSPWCRKGDLSRFPVGVEKESLEPALWNFDAGPVHLLLSADQENLGLAEAVARLAAVHCDVSTMLFTREEGKSAGNLRIFRTPEESVDGVSAVQTLMIQRNNLYKDAQAAGKPLPTFEPVLVVVKSLSRLRNTLERYQGPWNARASDDTPFNRLSVAMAKCQTPYNVRFLVAEDEPGLRQARQEEWYRLHVQGRNSGIWAGGGIDSQYALTVSRKPREYRGDVGEDFGFLVRGGAAVYAKLGRWERSSQA